MDAVAGGGNETHATAADLALRDFRVSLYEDSSFAAGMQRVFETRQIETEKTLAGLSRFFDGLEAVENVSACSLSNLNPIIHVPGWILNARHIKYAKGEFYFYTEEFTDVLRATCYGCRTHIHFPAPWLPLERGGPW